MKPFKEIIGHFAYEPAVGKKVGYICPKGHTVDISCGRCQKQNRKRN